MLIDMCISVLPLDSLVPYYVFRRMANSPVKIVGKDY